VRPSLSTDWIHSILVLVSTVAVVAVVVVGADVTAVLMVVVVPLFWIHTVSLSLVVIDLDAVGGEYWAYPIQKWVPYLVRKGPNDRDMVSEIDSLDNTAVPVVHMVLLLVVVIVNAMEQ
jgi:hypothetical protein